MKNGRVIAPLGDVNCIHPRDIWWIGGDGEINMHRLLCQILITHSHSFLHETKQRWTTLIIGRNR